MTENQPREKLDKFQRNNFTFKYWHHNKLKKRQISKYQRTYIFADEDKTTRI